MGKKERLADALHRNARLNDSNDFIASYLIRNGFCVCFFFSQHIFVSFGLVGWKTFPVRICRIVEIILIRIPALRIKNNIADDKNINPFQLTVTVVIFRDISRLNSTFKKTTNQWQIHIQTYQQSTKMIAIKKNRPLGAFIREISKKKAKPLFLHVQTTSPFWRSLLNVSFKKEIVFSLTKFVNNFRVRVWQNRMRNVIFIAGINSLRVHSFQQRTTKCSKTSLEN